MAISAEVLADTNGIIALLDASDLNHAAAIGVANSYRLVVPSTVLPEVDYLVTKYLGEAVAQAFLQDLLDGYFRYLSVDLHRCANSFGDYVSLPRCAFGTCGFQCDGISGTI